MAVAMDRSTATRLPSSEPVSPLTRFILTRTTGLHVQKLVTTPPVTEIVRLEALTL